MEQVYTFPETRPAWGAVTEAAKACGVTRRTIYRGLRSGALIVTAEGRIDVARRTAPLAFIPRRGAVDEFARLAGLEPVAVKAGLLAGRFGIAPDGSVYPRLDASEGITP